jgi:hypothetical protein
MKAGIPAFSLRQHKITQGFLNILSNSGRFVTCCPVQDRLLEFVQQKRGELKKHQVNPDYNGKQLNKRQYL